VTRYKINHSILSVRVFVQGGAMIWVTQGLEFVARLRRFFCASPNFSRQVYSEVQIKVQRSDSI